MEEPRSCIILSQGPVPTPEHTQVEGGGLRCWGLAKGLRENDSDMAITVAYNRSYVKEQFTNRYEGIDIAVWDLDSVDELIGAYDTVIVSYCMGGLSTRVVDALAEGQQLVLDCNVPIYVEASARESKDVEGEYAAFANDVMSWAHVLRRGDIFLCASESQKSYYKGVLSGLGRINPITYSDDMIKIVPYGVYREEPTQKATPISDLITDDKKYLKVLWFGGIYPWFDIRSLADAIKRVNEKVPAKLVVVGAKNPFNNHPDFVSRYEQFIDYVSSEEMQEYVIVKDWIDFKDRADWYLDSDIVVVFNKLGEENKLAWRTRLVDFMWADLPVLTNGGDPLGEIMIERDAAVRMASTESLDVAQAIMDVLGADRSRVKSLRHNMSKLKKEYYWGTITGQLSKDIKAGRRAKDLTGAVVFSSGQPQYPANHVMPRKILAKVKKVPAFAKKHGYKATALIISEMVRNRLADKALMPRREKSGYIFISHQLDMSGAPFIAIDMALEFKKSGKKVEFYTYLPAHKDNLARLKKAGIKPHILLSKDRTPRLVLGDTIILNTVAHSEEVKENIFSALEEGTLSELIWYLHEDDPELLFRDDEKKRIKKLVETKKIKMLVAALKVRDNYVRFFGTEENILLQPYRHVVPSRYHRVRQPEDFKDKLTFVLPGTVGDGRKGQLPIFYAFVQFLNTYYKANRLQYRDFELVLVGLSDDFISRQLILHKSALKNHFSYHGKVTWLDDLDIVSKGNMTICYSMREALPLFVFEGMINGHPVLRNDSSGMEEQLVDGKNGYYLATHDFDQVVDTIEKVLNKQKTSNELLSRMSKKSYDMAKRYEQTSYLEYAEDGK